MISFGQGLLCTKADTKVTCNNNCFTEFDDPLQFVLSAPHVENISKAESLGAGLHGYNNLYPETSIYINSLYIKCCLFDASWAGVCHDRSNEEKFL